jgi:hypothetical protein
MKEGIDWAEEDLGRARYAGEVVVVERDARRQEHPCMNLCPSHGTADTKSFRTKTDASRWLTNLEFHTGNGSVS